MKRVRMRMMCMIYKALMSYWFTQDNLKLDFGRLQSATARVEADRAKNEEKPSEEKWAAERQALLDKLDIATKGRLEEFKELVKLQEKEKAKEQSSSSAGKSGGGKGDKAWGKGKAEAGDVHAVVLRIIIGIRAGTQTSSVQIVGRSDT